MNYKMIRYILGTILKVEALLMCLPALVAFWYGEGDLLPFLVTILVASGLGLGLALKRPQNTVIYAREGFVITSLSWIVMSLVGALPFRLAGAIPHYIDAVFETVSGFTTTGASILTDVEAMGRGLLFWRSFTHWVGGMGVLVFVMAVLPMTDGHGMHLMRAEVPGPTVGKLVSRLGDTAKILYGIYLAMTVLETVLLLAGGMPLFDACVHAFGTAGTGGFSCRDLSVGAYQSAYFDVVIGIFMLLFGVNFNLYYFLLIRRFREVFGSEELRAYLLVVAAAVAAITADICRMYGDVWTSLRHAFFQVSSIITTTGYGTVDFDLWPTFSKSILVTLMFVGACAGSTGGGIKISRILILLKASVSEMKKMLHPNAVATTRLEGKPVSEKTLRGAHIYFTVYMAVFVVSFLLLSIEQKGLVTTFTALAACINNIGPGLEMVGPMGNFSAFSPASKLLLSFDMLVGRLEIFPMLLLFAPSNWRRRMNIRRASRRD